VKVGDIIVGISDQRVDPTWSRHQVAQMIREYSQPDSEESLAIIFDRQYRRTSVAAIKARMGQQRQADAAAKTQKTLRQGGEQKKRGKIGKRSNEAKKKKKSNTAAAAAATASSTPTDSNGTSDTTQADDGVSKEASGEGEHIVTIVELTSQHAISEGLVTIADGSVTGALHVNVTSQRSARPCMCAFVSLSAHLYISLPSYVVLFFFYPLSTCLRSEWW
jgi:DNA-binding transcriptional MerR regulator